MNITTTNKFFIQATQTKPHILPHAMYLLFYIGCHKPVITLLLNSVLGQVVKKMKILSNTPAELAYAYTLFSKY